MMYLSSAAVSSDFTALYKSYFIIIIIMIEVRPTALTLTCDLDFQSLASYDHEPRIHKISSSKVSQFILKDRVEVNGRTDERTDGQTNGR